MVAKLKVLKMGKVFASKKTSGGTVSSVTRPKVLSVRRQGRVR